MTSNEGHNILFFFLLLGQLFGAAFCYVEMI